jgi:hypothetical protein
LSTNKNQEKIQALFHWSVFCGFCLALIPWLNTQLQRSINADIAYLTLSAERLLDGIRMSEGYYDTNPPLSIMVQIPAIILTKLTNIPIYYATNIYVLILLVLSITATSKLLSFFKDVSIGQRISILSAYLLTATILTDYDFGQREHLLGMALFPLVLAQILITQKTPFPRILKLSVLATGSVFILLKPYFGLVPAAIFIHRTITQRRVNVVFDTDFLWLGGIAIGYLAVISLFFDDFLTIILPDVITYYLSDISPAVICDGIILMLMAIVPFFVAQLFLKEAPKLISALSLISVLSFTPYIMQGKGWYYHTIPGNIFLYSAAILLFNVVISTGTKASKKTKLSDQKRELVGFILSMLLLFTLVIRSYLTLPSFNEITHEEYKNTNFAKKIEGCSREKKHPCSFLVLDTLMGMSKELAIYTGTQHASRFPNPWYMPYILKEQDALDTQQKAHLTQEEIDTAINKYMALIAEDIERYDPEIIFRPNVVYVLRPGAPPFDLMNYTREKAPELFAPIWDRYEIESVEMVDRLDYLYRKPDGEDLVRYDIYKKKGNLKEE